MKDSRITEAATAPSAPNAFEEARPSSATVAREEGVEATLAAWWQELLLLDHVGLDDDFFEAGGHSLLGVQLFAKVKETYGVDLALSTLFEARTVRLLAEVICQERESAKSEPESRFKMEGVEATLAAWWQELLLLDHVGLDDDFFEAGGHSLLGVQLFAKVKETYEVDLALSTLFEARTVRLLAEVICQERKSATAEPESWFKMVPIQPEGSRAPLFWIPGGNGTSVLAFRQVSQLLGSDQPVYGFEAKMPEPDQEFQGIAERATQFLTKVKALQPDGPYALVGFCGGGYTAFEMARQLAEEGKEVGFLGIIECADDRHPSTFAGKARFRLERAVWRIQKLLGRGPKGLAQWAVERLSSFAQGISLRIRRVVAGLLGKPIPPLPAGPVDMFEKARRIVARYALETYPGKAVVILSNDTYYFCGVSPAVDPRLIWCKLSQGGSEVLRMPGDHMDILGAPIVYQFAEELKRRLEPVTAR
jgi:thioesterase domain-containing protein/acyl carrier protein